MFVEFHFLIKTPLSTGSTWFQWRPRTHWPAWSSCKPFDQISDLCSLLFFPLIHWCDWKLTVQMCIWLNLFSQGVEGIRGRQGLEGPKGDEVSSTLQLRFKILLERLFWFKKKQKTLIVIRELLDLKESRVLKGIKAMLWVPWLDWINFSVAHSFLNTLLFRPWLCAVTLQGAPGKDGLDGVPGVDGAKVTFNSKHFCSRLQHLYTLIPKTAAWRVYIKEMYRS